MGAFLSVSGPVFHPGNIGAGCSEEHHRNDSRLGSQKGEKHKLSVKVLESYSHVRGDAWKPSTEA